MLNKSKHFALYSEVRLTKILNEGAAGQLKRLEGHYQVSCYGPFSVLNKNKGAWYFKPLSFVRYLSACVVHEADVVFFNYWSGNCSLNITGPC